MSDRAAAVFGIPGRGHFERLRFVISDLVRHGYTAYVFTDTCYEREVELAGGRFFDLFAAYPLEEVDDESVPIPCRYVTFAGAHAEAIAGDLERLGVSVVVYDTFAVVGRVAARLLGLPHVNICAGHNMDPARFVPMFAADPRVSLSPACHRAVETLRGFGIEDASPFSYLSGLSPFLNVYCEPAAYLTMAEREVFEPVAFYGSLPSIEEIAARSTEGGSSLFGTGAERQLRVYVSFGTVVWRYWEAKALEVLRTISGALATLPDVRGLISLGGAKPEPEAVRALTRPNVAVAEYVDQWRVLREADAFITHQGLNSTHEAIFNLVPMISYPFFSDQPTLAEKCYGLGIATPLRDSMPGGVTEEAVHCALERVAADRDSMQARLVEARELERAVIAGRDSVVERITALI
jgi:UDP:flavonoid glycosyltransferase YjiC (YdhE family)